MASACFACSTSPAGSSLNQRRSSSWALAAWKSASQAETGIAAAAGAMPATPAAAVVASTAADGVAGGPAPNGDALQPASCGGGAGLGGAAASGRNKKNVNTAAPTRKAAARP